MPTLAKVPKYSAILIAVGTLYFYLIVSFYTSGYLAFFGAEAHWFNPSVLQMASLATNGIFAGLLYAGAVFLAFAMSGAKKPIWLAMLLLFVLVSSWYTYTTVSANVLYGYSIQSQIFAIATIPFFLALALFYRYIEVWSKDSNQKQRESLLEVCEELEQARSRAIVNPQIDDPGEYRRSIDELLTAMRQVIDEHARVFSRYSVWMGLLPLWLFTTSSYSLGMAHGAEASRRITVVHRSGLDLDLHRRILFTDGTSALIRDFSGDEPRTIFVLNSEPSTFNIYNKAEGIELATNALEKRLESLDEAMRDAEKRQGN